MMKVILDKNFLIENSRIVKEKISIWEEVTKLNFDNNGRVLIGKIKGNELVFNDFIEYFSGENSIKNTSRSFIKCFNKYLEDNDLSIYISKSKIEKMPMLKGLNKSILEKSINYFGNYENIFSKKVNKIDNPDDIGLDMLFLNRVRVDSKYGTHDVKFTKILACVQKYWEEDNPEYKDIIIKLRDLKYSSKEERSYLKKRKLELEKHNLYFDQQKILNKVYLDGGELWLSINPIDEFTASGSQYEDKECYPTSFRTCIRNKIKMINGEVFIEVKSQNSNPQEQLLVSKIKNKGLIYVKNGNSIKGENVELFGYKLRANVWLDTNSIFIPKFYPTLTNDKKKYIYRLIEGRAGINVCDVIDDYKLGIQDFNNNKVLYESFYKYLKNLYIDNIYIKNNEIYLTNDLYKNIFFRSIKETLKNKDWQDRI